MVPVPGVVAHSTKATLSLIAIASWLVFRVLPLRPSLLGHPGSLDLSLMTRTLRPLLADDQIQPLIGPSWRNR
jgi:hypothetical protein